VSYGQGLAEATGGFGPPLDVGPVPHQAHLERGDGLRELWVPLAPHMDSLGACHAKSLGDLACSDEVVHVDLSAGHGAGPYGWTRTDRGMGR
jgi:hypothetical protein